MPRRRTRATRPATTLVTALATMAVSSLAGAAPPDVDVELAWDAPAGCPTKADVRREIDAILRDSKASARVQARATVRGHDGDWRLALSVATEGTGDPAGARTLDASSCRDLASATALIVALAVDPESRPVVASPEPPPKSEPTATVAPAKRSTHRLAVGAAAAFDFGTLPSLGAGAVASIAWLRARLRAELRAALWAGQRIEASGAATGPAGGVDLRLYDVEGTACLSAVGPSPDDTLTLAPCLGLLVTRMEGSGFSPSGNPAAHEGATSWMAAEGGAMATVSLAHFLALRLDGGLVVPFARPRFVSLSPTGTVEDSLHRPAMISGRWAAGVELRFF